MTAYRYVRTSRLAAQRDVRWMVDAADLDQMPAAGRVRRGQDRGRSESNAGCPHGSR